MTPEAEPDRADYQLRLMIERMQRDGRSVAAIEEAVVAASGRNNPGGRPDDATASRAITACKPVSPIAPATRAGRALRGGGRGRLLRPLQRLACRLNSPNP